MLIKEFREFALKGNLLDIAVGFVLGAAFATVMTSLVENVLTPIIAAIAGQPDFSALVLRVGDAEIRYGLFLNAVIAFFLVALALYFLVVKPANAMRARYASAAEETPGPWRKHCSWPRFGTSCDASDLGRAVRWDDAPGGVDLAAILRSSFPG